MQFAGYFDVTARGELRQFAAASMNYTRDLTVRTLLGKPSDSTSADERQYAAEFLRRRIAVTRDAAAARGRFPIVVYHAGANSPYTDNADLCEFLASRGYVVVSSIYQQADGKSFNMNGRDGSSVLDMQLLIARISREPYADWRHVGVIGHSAGAQAALILGSSSHAPADAIVSLDNTEDYNSLAEHLWDAMTVPVLEGRSHVRTPMLFAAGPTALFEMADSLSHSERWYLTLPTLRHDDYTSLGIAAREALDWRDVTITPERPPRTAASAARREYDLLIKHVHIFLDATLKSDTIVGWSNPPVTVGSESIPVVRVAHVPAGSFGLPFESSQDSPPTPSQLRRLLQRDGAAAVIGELQRHWPRDSAGPLLSGGVLGVLLFELALRGDSVEARALLNGYRRLDPQLSAMPGYMDFLGDLRATLGHPEDAQAWYRTVLTVDAENEHARAKIRGVRPP